MFMNFGDYLLHINAITIIEKTIHKPVIRNASIKYSIKIEFTDDLKYLDYDSEEKRNKVFDYIIKELESRDELIKIPYERSNVHG